MQTGSREMVAEIWDALGKPHVGDALRKNDELEIALDEMHSTKVIRSLFDLLGSNARLSRVLTDG